MKSLFRSCLILALPGIHPEYCSHYDRGESFMSGDCVLCHAARRGLWLAFCLFVGVVWCVVCQAGPKERAAAAVAVARARLQINAEKPDLPDSVASSRTAQNSPSASSELSEKQTQKSDSESGKSSDAEEKRRLESELALARAELAEKQEAVTSQAWEIAQLRLRPAAAAGVGEVGRQGVGEKVASAPPDEMIVNACDDKECLTAVPDVIENGDDDFGRGWSVITVPSSMIDGRKDLSNNPMILII